MTVKVRLALLGALAFALLASSPAAAGGGCGQAVIDDWTDNARIDGRYKPNCYRSAIAALPEDLASYSSAEDDINRALQARLRELNADQQPADPAPSGGGQGGSGGGSASSGGSGGSDGGGSNGGGSGDDPQAPSTESSGDRGTQQAEPDGETAAETTDAGSATGPVAGPSAEALDSELEDGGSSLPVAVIALLAALGAAALATAGWLVTRQVRRRRS